jgi:hypothetical protein
MIDINKLRELNAALQEGLISQEEYDQIKADLINKSDSVKANLPNLLTDRLNSNSSVHTIPTDGLQHIIINNNNNNNNANNNSDGTGCYQGASQWCE